MIFDLIPFVEKFAEIFDMQFYKIIFNKQVEKLIFTVGFFEQFIMTCYIFTNLP